MYEENRGRTKESGDSPEDREQVLLLMKDSLLSWYGNVRRDLPWREDLTPYRVWISEIMLQQTRIEAVKAYYIRFMEALPDIPALAGVTEERLLKLWEGLGYYSRARNLKKAAEIICEDFGGEMPASFEAVRALPGIGDYTAGAICSLAFGIPKPAVDGNVLRILSRLFADDSDIMKQPVRKAWSELLERCMDRENPGRYNEALMELGETVCLPKGKPFCRSCPFSSVCLAHRRGEEERYPRKAGKKGRRVEERTIFLLEWENLTAIRRREGGLLASMFEFPGVPGHLEKEEIPGAIGILPGQIDSVEKLPDAVHIFSHVEWHMTGWRVRLKARPEGLTMADKNEIREKYPMPGAFRVYLKCVQEGFPSAENRN